MHNPNGALRVVVTKALPGDRWLKVLTAAGCRVEVSADPDTILSNSKIKALIGDKCDGVIGQLTEVLGRGGDGGGRPLTCRDAQQRAGSGGAEHEHDSAAGRRLQCCSSSQLPPAPAPRPRLLASPLLDSWPARHSLV